MIHQSLLRYRGARYLWWFIALVIASCVIYATHDTTLQPSNGGTWQGYTLGTVGALLIVWLAMLGIRKRTYTSSLGTVQGWTSAHVYLGTALLLVGTLHSALKFGWNIHTFAYVLMVLVILSGFVGVYCYMLHPTQVAKNRAGGIRSELFSELFELNRQGSELATKCDPAVRMAVESSIERTSIGGGVYSQLFGRDGSRFVSSETGAERSDASLNSNVDQQGVIDFVADRVPRAVKGAEAANLQQLVVLLCRRQSVLRRIRRDIRLHGWLQVWLYVHVPLTIALLGLLLAHIVSTFVYW